MNQTLFVYASDYESELVVARCAISRWRNEFEVLVEDLDELGDKVRIIARFHVCLVGSCIECGLPTGAGSVSCPICGDIIPYRSACDCSHSHTPGAEGVLREHLREAHGVVNQIALRSW